MALRGRRVVLALLSMPLAIGLVNPLPAQAVGPLSVCRESLYYTKTDPAQGSYQYVVFARQGAYFVGGTYLQDVANSDHIGFFVDASPTYSTAGTDSVAVGYNVTTYQAGTYRGWMFYYHSC